MFTSLRIPVPGGELHVEHAGSGPPVVLLHAGGVNAAMWDELAEPLAERFHVVRYDARSHGRSSTATADHRLDDDLAAVLDALELGSAALVGSSMGGATAVDFAVAHPARAAALVLIGAGVTPLRYEDPFVLDLYAEQAAAIEARDPDRWIEAMLRHGVDGPRRAPEDVDPAIRARCRAMLAENVARHATATGQPVWRDARPRLGEIAAPTLVLIGELDLADLHATADELAASVPGARLRRLPGVGHMASMEAPAEVLDLVGGFLAETLAVAR